MQNKGAEKKRTNTYTHTHNTRKFDLFYYHFQSHKMLEFCELDREIKRVNLIETETESKLSNAKQSHLKQK